MKKIFDRDNYVYQLMDGASHSRILVVTGLRKVGKSTLAKDLFLPHYQSANGIPDDHVIKENVASWKKADRTLLHLEEVISGKILDDGKYLVFIDEI